VEWKGLYPSPAPLCPISRAARRWGVKVEDLPGAEALQEPGGPRVCRGEVVWLPMGGCWGSDQRFDITEC